MFRTIRCAALLLLASLACAAGASAAEPPPGTDPQLIRDHDEAIEIALNDPNVQDRLALRPGLEVQAGLVDFSTSPVPADRKYGTAWLVTWHQEGREDDPELSVVVSLDQGVLNAGGLGLVVMPETRVDESWFGSAWPWSLLAASFLLCMAGAWRRGNGAGMLLPLAILSAAFVITLENVVPRDVIRGGNIALFAVAVAALVLGAWTWTRRPRGASAPFEPRFHPVVWGIAWLAGLVVTAVRITNVKMPIDVAVASDVGARLMRGGVPVYGNFEDAPGIVVHGDTYGPFAYLAYVPGVMATDDRTAAVLWSSFAMLVLVGVLLAVAGARAGSLGRGLWAAAAWTTCPIVAIGVFGGSNDIVVALAVMVLLLVLTRPAWRGALVAVTAATKFLPILLGLALLRLRGETRRDMVRFLAGGTVTMLVTFAVALRGTEALGPFWERTVEYQLGRIDIKSLWGLAGIEPLRHVMSVAAIALAVYTLVRWRTLRPNVAAGAIAAILALLIAGLPQYWGSYGTWVVPAVLMAMLWSGTSPEEDDSTLDADAEAQPGATTSIAIAAP
jgi:hypothetical protein